MIDKILKWTECKFDYFTFEKYKKSDCSHFIIDTLIEEKIFRKFEMKHKLTRCRYYFSQNDDIMITLIYNLRSNLNQQFGGIILNKTTAPINNDILFYSKNGKAVCHTSFFFDKHIYDCSQVRNGFAVDNDLVGLHLKYILRFRKKV